MSRTGFSFLCAALISLLAGGCQQPGGGVDSDPDGGTGPSTHILLNGLSSDAFLSGRDLLPGLATAPLTESALARDADLLDAMESSEVASPGAPTAGALVRELLDYLYSCAMPPEANAKISLRDGSTVELKGGAALAPEWGEDGGSCDGDCQEWISACLLARINDYTEAPVEIVLAGDHPSLAGAVQARTEFPLRDGSFYGNVFSAGPLTAYACSGPGSAIPELTNRMCSAFGAGCVTEVTADCSLPILACTDTCYAEIACAGPDDSPTACYDVSLDSAFFCNESEPRPELALTAYSRVITAYLRHPTPTCGNNVCEPGEAGICAADCNGAWAAQVGGACHEQPGGVTVTAGGDIAVAGVFTDVLELGGATHLSSGLTDGFLARYDSAGAVAYGTVVDLEDGSLTSVAVDAQGNTIVAGYLRPGGTVALGNTTHTAAGVDLFVLKFDTGGAYTWGAVFENDAAFINAPRPAVAIAPGESDILFAGEFAKELVFPRQGPDITLATANGLDYDIAIARLDSSGAVQWAVQDGGSGAERLRALAATTTAAVVGGQLDRDGFVTKLDTSDGSVLWSTPIEATGSSRRVEVRTVDIAAGGTVAAGGRYRGTLGAPVSDLPSAGSYDGFVATMSGANGAPVWSRRFGGSEDDTVAGVSFGSGSELLVAGDFWGTVTVGATELTSRGRSDHFVVTLASDGNAGGATQLSGFVHQGTAGLARHGDSHGVLLGEFMGTVNANGTLLTNRGGSSISRQPADLLLTRFRLP